MTHTEAHLSSSLLHPRTLSSPFRLGQALALPAGSLCWKGLELPAGHRRGCWEGQALSGTGAGPALLSIPSSWSPGAGTAGCGWNLAVGEVWRSHYRPDLPGTSLSSRRGRRLPGLLCSFRLMERRADICRHQAFPETEA